jgi:hypothetical protein
LAYNLSLRNLEAMMAERSISVDHATIHRWTVRLYALPTGALQPTQRHLPSYERMQAVDARLNELGVKDHLDEPWGPVKADETFTIRGKLTSGFAGGQDVPMLFRGEKFTLPYTSLEPFIKLVVER